MVWAVRVLRRQGRTLAETSAVLGGPAERTLRDWCRGWRVDRLRPRCRGRPPRELDPAERAWALERLRAAQGGLSRDALVAALPGAPVRALRDLQRCWRRARRRRTHDLVGKLRWPVPGRVWTLDLTDVPAGALGPDITKLLVARDLASGAVLACVPLRDKSAAEVVPAIRAIFEQHGAPLVVKLDNEGAFRSHQMRRMLRRHGVLVLFSPPYYAPFNGSIEKTIGHQKARIERIAAANGRPGIWTLGDVAQATAEHNELARPWGARGPSPRERFEGRLMISAEERQRLRDRLADALRHERLRAATILAEAVSRRGVGTSAQKRAALSRVLVDLGYLEIRRRRVTPAFSRQKAARIT